MGRRRIWKDAAARLRAWRERQRNKKDFLRRLREPVVVTFSGTPKEVVRSLRRWQKGLEP